MESLFSKKNVPMVILNVSTIVIVAIMLMVSEAAAKPMEVQAIQTFSNGLLSYQGTMTDKQGSALTGSYEMTFRIYPSVTGGTALWTESRVGTNAVPVKNGLFNVMLGSLVPIPATVWETQELYLGVKIGSDAEMSPREKLSMVPSAARADVADLALTVPFNSIGGDNIIDTSITQQDAPTLIRSGENTNTVIRTGNVVYQEGSKENGEIIVSYPCFSTGVYAFHAINAHFEANHSQVIALNGAGACEAIVIVSPPTSNPIRIYWIAIGD